ncbi:MAG: GyrI-like domain-containing protein [Acidimicrobiia bacterium]
MNDGADRWSGRARDFNSSVARLRRRAVDRAVDHVLAHLAGELDLAGLAAVSGYSPWHFQRVFREAMGESPAMFVARARVERAVALARAEPERAWQDIAPEVGFSAPAQLSRAFRERFGRSARSWDRITPLTDQPMPLGGEPFDDRVGGCAVSVRLERLAPYRFAYRRISDPYRRGNLAAAWDDVAAWGSTGSSAPVMIGMSWDDPATTPLEQCRYDLGIALDPTDAPVEDSSERWMPSTVAAVASVDGDIGAVSAAWEHMHRVWLPSSPRRRSALPSIERFHADPRPTWSRWRLDCILPVAPHR